MKAVMNLPIKGRWFDMIARGEKREEYRDCQHPQASRAYIWAMNDRDWSLCRPVAILRNGYRMDSRALAVEVVGFSLRGLGEERHPEWGEPKAKRLHIAIWLGRVLTVGDYRTVREFVYGGSEAQEGSGDARSR